MYIRYFEQQVKPDRFVQIFEVVLAVVVQLSG